MDTLVEESSILESNDDIRPFLLPPEIRIERIASDDDLYRGTYTRETSRDQSGHSSRRSSTNERRTSSILTALRRPSQTIALSIAHAVMNQAKLLKSQDDRPVKTEKQEKLRKYNRRLGNDALTTVLSALYGKLLVVLGIAFPITEIISPDVQPFFYQGFYLYLYLGSISFVSFMYIRLIRNNSLFPALGRKLNKVNSERRTINHNVGHKHVHRYGSFYLRLGAIAFGIGSMVYSGLEFARYFELRNNHDCYTNILQAVTPALRTVLTILQIQFIFLNSKELEMNKHKIISRFGLMHMIGANLCEWLYVIIEETKHEIFHLADHNLINSTLHSKYCQNGGIMGSLVANASPFLFPCTIEYSLICAVILYEMWKKIKIIEIKFNKNKKGKSMGRSSPIDIHSLTNPNKQSGHRFTVDCSKSHKGLFAGIIVTVLTIISLIMFFVLANDKQVSNKNAAEFQVNVVELILYIITIITIIFAMRSMKDLKYERKDPTTETSSGNGLDITLLVVAQTGVFIYSIFSMIGSYFTMSNSRSTLGLIAEIFSFTQTCLQTIFVLDGWWHKCSTLQQSKHKPGRELITFLIIANMAMWSINALEKNRAEFKPTHLEFFGDWAWTTITHVSMPLAIFYRFHSTICLFEIWKNAYKLKNDIMNFI